MKLVSVRHFFSVLFIRARKEGRLVKLAKKGRRGKKQARKRSIPLEIHISLCATTMLMTMMVGHKRIFS